MRKKTTTKITPICVQSRSTTTTLCVRVERTNSFYFVPLYDSFSTAIIGEKFFCFHVAFIDLVSRPFFPSFSPPAPSFSSFHILLRLFFSFVTNNDDSTLLDWRHSCNFFSFFPVKIMLMQNSINAFVSVL